MASIRPPSYIDIETKPVPRSVGARIACAALPFIALHRPFGRAMTLLSESIHTVSSFQQMVRTGGAREGARTALAVVVLASTFFLHPVGLFLCTLQDLGGDTMALVDQLQKGHLTGALGALGEGAYHLLYAGTLWSGSIPLIAASILLSMGREGKRSWQEFQKGHLIEAISHGMMSGVRGFQALPLLSSCNWAYRDVCQTLNRTAMQIRNRAALFFFSAARFCVHPHWKMTDLWLGAIQQGKAGAFAKAFFGSALLFPLACSGLLAGQVSHFTAFLMAPEPFIRLKGDREPQALGDKDIKVFQLNCCLTAGGFARMFGGLLRPDAERADQIADLIQEENPDLVCLQEVSDLSSAQALYARLSPQYAEFYLNVGATPWILQNPSGLFVASQTPLSQVAFHSFSDIPGVESMVNKGYLRFTTDRGTFITTHLSPSSDDLTPSSANRQTRVIEQERIAAEREKGGPGPFFVLGDLNIHWGGEEAASSALLTKGAVQAFPATCESDFLIAHNWRGDTAAEPSSLALDYFISHGEEAIETRVLPTFDRKNPESALSDHAALITTIRAPRAADLSPRA